MARARVFVSSTYYDLKHLRSSLENFVESLGFDAVLSEKGKVAYAPNMPLDESCYREVSTCDIFVLVIGGRYGSAASAERPVVRAEFYDRYNSVTRMEFRAALDRDIPLYVLIERAVYADYETWLKNKTRMDIEYAHADSVNIFQLIEEVLTLPQNNPTQQFDRYGDIETWLREQWSGLFRELLRRRGDQSQLASLQAQVKQLAELNKTMKAYLEEVVTRVAPPAESASLIESETQRLADIAIIAALYENSLATALIGDHDVPPGVVRDAVLQSSTPEEFLRYVVEHVGDEFIAELAKEWLANVRDQVAADLIEMKELLASEAESHAQTHQRRHRAGRRL